MLSHQFVRPADNPVDPENIVIGWIEGAGPRHLEAVLQHYRDLTIYRDQVEDPVELDRQANAIFDKLIVAAETQIAVSAKAEAQLRRIQKRNEVRMSYQDKCNHAIARWRAGERFGI